MGNEHFLIMDRYLHDLLQPFCEGRTDDAFAFINRMGNPIDDRMFRRLIFRPLLQALGIPIRDLYACLHTFVTRAVQQGMKPHEVAYLMGDSVEVALATYFHNYLRQPDFRRTCQ